MAKRKKLLYPGIEEVEQERRKAEKREKQYNSTGKYYGLYIFPDERQTYDEYERWLIRNNID